jgi:hypothetical protein
MRGAVRRVLLAPGAPFTAHLSLMPLTVRQAGALSVSELRLHVHASGGVRVAPRSADI